MTERGEPEAEASAEKDSTPSDYELDGEPAASSEQSDKKPSKKSKKKNASNKKQNEKNEKIDAVLADHEHVKKSKEPSFLEIVSNGYIYPPPGPHEEEPLPPRYR